MLYFDTSHISYHQLIGFNCLEHLVVLEYCVEGSLRQFLQERRQFFSSELDAATGELGEGARDLLLRVPNKEGERAEADLISSLHTQAKGPGRPPTELFGHLN